MRRSGSSSAVGRRRDRAAGSVDDEEVPPVARHDGGDVISGRRSASRAVRSTHLGSPAHRRAVAGAAVGAGTENQLGKQAAHAFRAKSGLSARVWRDMHAWHAYRSKSGGPRRVCHVLQVSGPAACPSCRGPSAARPSALRPQPSPAGNPPARTPRLRRSIPRRHRLRRSYAAATTAASRREMTLEIPSLPIETPYRESAASMVRF